MDEKPIDKPVFEKDEKEPENKRFLIDTIRGKSMVVSFLNEMNPELNKKIVEIKEEIARIDNNIQQLRDLKTEFPNQVLIDKKLSQWQVLGIQLSQVYDDIYQQVETAYVAYRIDEIQGRKKFGVLSEELLKKANAALANAETTKSTIEEQLSE
jgi:hypothetical protein